jgi:glucuronate isomerase
MSQDLRKRIFTALDEVAIIDPHTHINPHQPASRNLADILGYHYYTELAHSAGLSRERIEEPGLDPQEKVQRLFQNLGPLNNTIQYSWFIEIAQEFLDFDDEVLLPEHADSLWETAHQKMSEESWEETVIEKSGLTQIFLTNDFDTSHVYEPTTSSFTWRRKMFVTGFRAVHRLKFKTARHLRKPYENSSFISPRTMLGLALFLCRHHLPLEKSPRPARTVLWPNCTG